MISALLLCPEFAAPLPRWLVAASLALVVVLTAMLALAEPPPRAGQAPIALASANR